MERYESNGRRTVQVTRRNLRHWLRVLPNLKPGADTIIIEHGRAVELRRKM